MKSEKAKKTIASSSSIQDHFPDKNAETSVKMKPESHYGEGIRMKKEPPITGVEKESPVYSYWSYNWDRYQYDNKVTDPHLQEMKKILTEEKGYITEVHIISHCYIDPPKLPKGKTEAQVPVDPSEAHDEENKYRTIMKNQGVNYSKARFKYTALAHKSAGENDGGCTIEVQFKYISNS